MLYEVITFLTKRMSVSITPVWAAFATAESSTFRITSYNVCYTKLLRPKRGFHNRFRKEYVVVNVRDLNRFDAGTIVDVSALRAAGIVKNVEDGVKLLGDGEVNRAVTVKVDKASKEAARKVAAAGGILEVASSC